MSKVIPLRSPSDWQQSILAEYMLLANPDDRVNGEVILLKDNFIQTFGRRIAKVTQPHITIAKLDASEETEDFLCDCIQKVCNLQYNFTVALNGIRGFKPRTIYVHVENPKPFRQLAKNLSRIEKLIPSYACNITFLVKIPHMTIARGITDGIIYEKAIAEYEQFTFRDVFTLDKLVLLKWNGTGWQHVKDFYLPTERTLFN